MSKQRLTPEDFKVKIEIPVQWGDMDSFRHVNNTMYLRWAESSRLAYFEALFGTNAIFNNPSLILAWIDCKFIFPMTYPDTAIIGIKVAEIQEDRFTVESYIFSKQHQRVAAISKQVMVAYDYKKLKKVPLPQEWLEMIRELEE